VTPERWRECVNTLGYSNGDMARMLGRTPRRVNRWYSGKNAVPDDVADWVEAWVAEFRSWPTRNPPPQPRHAAPGERDEED